MNPLSCERARRLLGASRRDDWSADELAALGAHLATCAECRQVEAQYREVGEHIRQLPSTPPPEWFRARVFAAIAADQEAQRRIAATRAARRPAAATPTLERVAGAETDPQLVAIRLPARPLPRRPRPLPRRIAVAAQSNMRAVAALAAMLLLALLGATLIPASPFYLLGGSPSVSHYSADGRVARLASAGASSAWLAYAGPDASGQYLLLAQSRQGGSPVALASGSSAPIAIEAVTGRWVLWRETDGADWRLSASALPSGQTTTLLDSMASGPGAAAALHDVWSSGGRVLAAISTRGGSGLVVQFDLSTSAPASVIERAAPSVELASPSFDGRAYYWANIARDEHSGLQSAIWRGADAAHTQQVTSDDEAFHPQVTHGKLVWISAASAPPTNGDEIDAGLAAAVGSVQERDLSSGDQRQIGTNASASSLAASGGLVLWKSGAKTYSYDLGAQGPSRVDGQLRGASVAQLSDTALVWAQPGNITLNVYNLQ
jgi:hypothetical protein